MQIKLDNTSLSVVWERFDAPVSRCRPNLGLEKGES